MPAWPPRIWPHRLVLPWLLGPVGLGLAYRQSHATGLAGVARETQRCWNCPRHPRAGSGRLTIRSSRDRFAASLVALSCSTPLGRCASRLNSGVRAHMKDLWFGLFMLSLGVGMLIWTQKDFVGLVRRTGRLSMWAGLLPSTRVGLIAVSLFAVLAGISVLVPLNKSSGVGNVVSIVLIVLLFGGLIHDLVSWLWQHFKRGGGEP